MHKWLRERKISEQVEKEFNLSFDNHITIPVYDSSGQFSFNKYRRSPDKDTGMKYWYDKGASVELYGWHKAKDFKTIVFCEGELDVLLCWSQNIPAISSTGGAMSFQSDWTEFLKDKELLLAFDNDEAGAKGMIKVLEHLPHAKIVFVPKVKDLTDYVVAGKDLKKLFATAKQFNFLDEVKENRAERIARCNKENIFHDLYIEKHTPKAPKTSKRVVFSNDKVVNAKNYPMTNLITFNSNKKALCPYHKEDSPSFHYNEDTNTGYCFGVCGKIYDVISVYQKLNNCSFNDAVKELNKL